MYLANSTCEVSEWIQLTRDRTKRKRISIKFKQRHSWTMYQQNFRWNQNRYPEGAQECAYLFTWDHHDHASMFLA